MELTSHGESNLDSEAELKDEGLTSRDGSILIERELDFDPPTLTPKDDRVEEGRIRGLEQELNADGFPRDANLNLRKPQPQPVRESKLLSSRRPSRSILKKSIGEGVGRPRCSSSSSPSSLMFTSQSSSAIPRPKTTLGLEHSVSSSARKGCSRLIR